MINQKWLGKFKVFEKIVEGGSSSPLRCDTQYKAHTKKFRITRPQMRHRILLSLFPLLSYCDAKTKCNVLFPTERYVVTHPTPFSEGFIEFVISLPISLNLSLGATRVVKSLLGTSTNSFTQQI